MTEVEKYKRQWFWRWWRQRGEAALSFLLASVLLAVPFMATKLEALQKDSSQVGFWVLATIVAAPSVVFFWIGVRRLRETLAPPQVERDMSELAEARRALNQFLWKAGAWKDDLLDQQVPRFDELSRDGDWNGMLEECSRLQARYGPHPLMKSLEIYALKNLKRHTDAANRIEELLSLQIEHMEARLCLACDLAVQRVLEGRPDQLGMFFDLLTSAGVSDAFKACCLDSVATLMVYRHDLPRRDVLLSWAQEALRLCPDRLTLKGTLASALCENDRWDEAEPLLREVLEKSPGLVDQGICAAYLARLCHRRGDLPGAKDWLAYSRYVFPSSELDARLRRELPELYEKTAGGSLRRPAT